MIDGSLDTTNVMLGIMAAVSVLEALLLVGMGVGGFLLYRRTTALVAGLEARQIAPLRARVDAILADVKGVTSRVSRQTERVDHAMDRVDETADRVKTRVRDKVNQSVAVARGVRAAITTILHDNGHEEPTDTPRSAPL